MQTLSYHLQSAVLRLIAQLRYQLLDHKFRYTLHIGLIVSTLLLAVLTSVIISQPISQSPILGLLLVGLVLSLTAFTLMYNYMEGTVVALFVSTTLGDIDLGQGVTPTLLIALALAVIWLIKSLLVQRSFRSLRPTIVNRTTIIFILAVIFSYIWSTIYVAPLVRPLQDDKFLPRFTTLLVIVVSPMMLLMAANFVRSPKKIQRLLIYYLAINTFVLALLAAGLQTPGLITQFGQWFAWTGIFCLAMLLFQDDISYRRRIWLAAALLLALIVAFVRDFSWVSGWIPLSVGIAVVAVIRTRWAIVAILIVLVGIVLFKSDSLQRAFEAENAESGQSRLAAGRLALDVGDEHFLFGTGPTGYYFYITHLGIYRFQLSHNNYIDIYAQTGIVGFTAWLAMWFSVGWTLWRGFRMAPPRGLERALSAAFLACFVTTMVSGMLGDWVTPFTYTQTIMGLPYTIQHWLFAGFGLSLYQHLKAQSQPLEVEA